ncbi:hypothetical protein GCM10011386_27620 [Parapedobacter defluvii]|uniref:Outer membrane protein beta-barrel domain-containing protein n=1 Tax=Parapedobacter defluvii TaxID=2045106 RepID=A0ABQ1M634_9SPHI|nr:hypothetical protein [Parapedobacter defluvii]RQP19843.1 MAG: hypothetical protein EAS52_01135 [Parapedobacter sp.]GGC33995.1 hypothetical protein GCM10011386_27620 [Parapedobacter defluvii]
MKRFYIPATLSVVIALIMSINVNAQSGKTEITRKNSWIKTGLNIGLPIAQLADQSNFTLGGEVKGQLMSTPNWGLGLASGYTHYFPKEGHENFGSIPAAVFARYYPARQGFFIGADLGYSFQTGSQLNGNGGMYARPQVGYHNRLWNIFGFYNGIFRKEADGSHIQYVGIGTTFNILFD